MKMTTDTLIRDLKETKPKMNTTNSTNGQFRVETDSLGEVKVAADRLWGAQTQRSLEHFSIGKDLIPREMITAYATLKKGAAKANHTGKRLDDKRYRLIVQTCDEILAGQHEDMFPLHVWMTGSGTQFNMNVNEVISNRCCQLAGTPLGSKHPVQRQHVAVVERLLSIGDAHCRRRQCQGTLDPCCRRATQCDRGQGGRMGRHREDRPHAHAGCDAAHAWPGMVGLCRDADGRSGADRIGIAGHLPACARRYGGRYRDQRRTRLRRGGRRRDRRTHETALCKR